MKAGHEWRSSDNHWWGPVTKKHNILLSVQLELLDSGPINGTIQAPGGGGLSGMFTSLQRGPTRELT